MTSEQTARLLAQPKARLIKRGQAQTSQRPVNTGQRKPLTASEIRAKWLAEKVQSDAAKLQEARRQVG